MSGHAVVEIVATTTLVAAPGCVAALVARRAPAALRHLLWRMVLVVFAVLPPVLWLVGALGVRRWEVLVPAPRAPHAPLLAPTAATPGDAPRPLPTAPTAQPAGVVSSEHRAGAPPPASAAALLWALGALVSSFLLLRQWLGMERIRRSASAVDEGRSLQCLVQGARELGLARAPTLATSPLVAVPSVLGWRRPTVILPADLPPGNMGVASCLLHELAHISRGDVAWLTACRVIQVLWWWHPLLGLTARELRETAEQACDDWAVALGDDRRGYAGLLVTCAARSVGAAGLTCGSRGRALKARLGRILDATRLPRPRLALWLRCIVLACGITAIVSASAVQVRAVPVRLGAGAPAAGEPASPWGQLPAEAVARLGLTFHFAQDRPRGPQVTVPTVEPHQLLEVGPEGIWYVIPKQPDLTMADVGRVDWWPELPQRLSSDGVRSDGPCLVIHFRDPEGIGRLAERHRNESCVVMLGERLVAGPTRTAPRLASAYLRFCDLPADQQAVIRPCVKGWPGSEGLFIPGSTDPQPFPTVPGTAQVAVTARFADGARPEDAECRFTPWQDSSRPPPYPVAAPTIVGDAGEWTIHNAAPGGWRISVTGRDFSQASAIVQVAAGDREKRVDLLLSRGGMVRGQVVSAETGEPLEGIYVSPRGTDFRTVRTDAEGRYVAEHVGVGPVQLFVHARDYVSVSADVGTLAEGGELEAAPVKLSRGGWIVGKVVPTPAPPRNLRWIGVVEPHWQDHVKVEQPASVGKDFTFRLGPLPAGVFRLDARLHTFDEVRFKIALQRWRGEVQNVRVEVGKEVTGVVILLSETPTR